VIGLRECIEKEFPSLVEIRHDIHQHPELMFEEHRTSGVVAEELGRLSIEHVTGLAGGTGVLGWLPATHPGAKTVAIRADMDALPIHEETGVEYASRTPGTMHACGHDGHTTILLGVARTLSQMTDRPNNVLFVFQPAEEGGGGGDKLCQEGALAGTIIGEKTDVIYGLHGWPARAQGAFSTKMGALMASTDQFHVTLRGRGGHAAAPEETRDPVVALAHCIVALQTLVSRNIGAVQSAVMTVGQINAGTAHNIIPETAEFIGTIRTVDPQVRVKMRERFDQVVQGVASGFGVGAEVQWEEGYPVTVNDEWATQRFLDLAGNATIEPHPKMGAEDFSYYGAHAPACFYFVGLCRPGETDSPGLHTPRFDFNDAVIPDCIEMMCRLALEPMK
jgi:amidohydrolase